MDLPNYDVTGEIVRHGRFAVYRGRRSGNQQPVLLKAPLRVPATTTDADELQREFTLLKAVTTAGVPRPYELLRTSESTCLVLEDRGFTPLSEVLSGGRLELPAFYSLALGVCAIVGELHRRGLTHGALAPTSILASRDFDQAQLINLGAPPRPGTQPGTRVPIGASVYISPEQTGRINRPADYRTDFYSLGVCFYEMLTGAPPFASEDLLELLHAHIAKSPTAPVQITPDIPEQLSRIVMKLLAKAAEDRYMSAGGITRDLERSREDWAAGRAGTFDLGQHDRSDRFLISQRLYGREREVHDLLQAFEQTCEGRTSLMLVAGYSGIGKTSLINELYRPIVRQRGYFIAGKFDQVVRNIPYGAITQALRSLVWQLLTESEDRLARWRARLSEALGANGGVLAEVIPEIELIVGRQPPPPPLDPAEARNRFGYVFQKFVAALARQEHPLVVFLDDLQWVDAATLELLHALITGPDIRHVLVIGAYRDNEVGADHLLTWATDRLEAAGARVSRLAVGPLELPDLTRLLQDTLHQAPASLDALARLIQAKTDGNPFFVIQFLKTLEQEGLFQFDRQQGAWTFDMGAIAGVGMTDNVVDLMTRRIRRLSEGAQGVLTLAACIGNPFDWDTLVTVSRVTPENVAADLAEALDAGLIHMLADSTASTDDSAHHRTYAFLHDRVQQAAYGLIPQERKKPVHLDVGRLLLGDTDAESADDRVFAILNHLNIGADLISDPAERTAVARLNLTAGRKAKSSAAYRAAGEYFRKGLALLAEHHWSSEYRLMFALHVEAAECEYLNGDFDVAESHAAELLGLADGPADQAHIRSLQVTLYENQSRWADAVSSGRAGLALFGIVFPDRSEDKQAALDHEVVVVRDLVGGRPIASLVDLPAMTDVPMRTALRLLTTLWAPAYISGDELLARLISATIVRLSLVHGNTEDSAYGYVTHAITVGPIRRDYRAAYEWGELALTVNRRFNDLRQRAKIHQQFQAHVSLWCRPFHACIPHAREACRSGLDAGDFTYAGYGAATEAWAAWLLNRDLDRFVRDYSPTLVLLEKCRMTDFGAAHRVMLNWALALQGRTADRLSLSDATFDEQAFIATYQDSAPFFLTFVWAARLHVAVLLQQYDEALAAAQSARNVAVTGTIWPVLVDFWGGLAAAGAWDAARGDDRTGHRRHLERSEAALRDLAETCPENFRCWWLLLAAEGHRVEARPDRAAALLDEATAYARQTGNLQQLALASEMRARLALARGEPSAGDFMGEAYSCYASWGASSKLTDLEERYGHLLAIPRPAARTVSAAVPAAKTDEPGFVDMATVLKVAHAIAVEIELDGLLRKLLKLALENAGAERGVFFHERGGSLVAEAEALADPEQVTVGRLDAGDAPERVALNVVRYVHRTGQDVVIHNAADDERFSGDPYVVRSGVRSILCVPVGHQGRLGGILYLENNLTTGAFTPERAEMMRILAAQTAISLENARLYEDMKREVARRGSAEQALRDALAEVEALKNRLEAENVYLQEEIRTQHNFNEIVGNSPVLLEALRKVERVAPTESTVLIVGETGSGKELFARAVHNRSRRRDRPLVKVNCGAIAPGLVESELFGHVKGAFTGAIDKRVGRFELADGGTIFLDEVGELPMDAQVKLLRVLQEQEFEPVGSSRTVRVSVRVIAATNRNLDQAVSEGRFRADLLYRLNVFPIEVPPLRQRLSDLGLLIGFFSTGLARKLGKPIQGVTGRSLDRMRAYAWPGNVRELQNVVERAAILAQGPILDLDATLQGQAATAPATAPMVDAATASRSADSLDEVQRLHILTVLKSTGGVVEGARGAAAILGLHPNTLRSRMKKLGISSRPAES